eukprot:354622-Chlamydomonas_euryale.AAC.7
MHCISCCIQPHAQVVVDAFDPSVLASDCSTKVDLVLALLTCFDPNNCYAYFHSTKNASAAYPGCIEALNGCLSVIGLCSLEVACPAACCLLDTPQVASPGPCVIHGVACWFDVFFNGSKNGIWLSTAPGLPTTHWFQLRCVLKAPIQTFGPCSLTGTLRLVAHNHQSYTVFVELSGPPLQPGLPPQVAEGKYDLKEPYYRQLTGATWQPQQQQSVVTDPSQLTMAAATHIY